MSITTGPKLPVDGLILNLDVFRTRDWSLVKNRWNDSSTLNSPGFLRGYGSGLTFDNSIGFFNFPLNNSVAEVEIERNNLDLNSGDFSLEAWIYPTSFTNTIEVFTFDTASVGVLRINTSGAIQFSSSSFTTSISGWTATLNQWNHIILTRSNNIAYGYKNGTLIGTSTGFNSDIQAGYLYVRKASASSGAVRIRTIRLWDRALDADEAKLAYINFKDRAYVPVPTTGLTANVLLPSSEFTVDTEFEIKPITASGGGGGYVYSVSPSLPSGVSLNIDTGVISGTISTLIDNNYTITVTDRILSQTSANFNLKINPSPLSVAVPNPSYTFGINSNVSFQPIIALQGFGTYTYSINPSLPTSSSPPSLTLNTSTGVISGVPSGYILDQTYTITVTDQASQTAQGSFQLIIETQPLSAITIESLVTGFTNTALTAIIPVTASGGSAPITYSISPSLPSGLSFNTNNGEITGTPTAGLAQTQYTVTVTDSVSQTAQNTFFLEISAALYNFTSHTFTNATATGRNGPTLAQCQSIYAGQPFLNGYFTVNTQGIQEWTVPSSGTYSFTVRGANGVASTGASTGCSGGEGIIQTFQIDLTQGTVLRLIVGQSGLANNQHGGGGGASAVLAPPYNTEASIIAIAGGGGGRRTQSLGVGIPGASFNTYSGFGTRNNTNSGNTIGTIVSNSVNNSQWTPQAATLGQGGPAANNAYGDGGAGFFGNGFDDQAGSETAKSLSTTALGGGAAGSTSQGGFGGGGDGAGSNGGGGGGGYTGGSGGHTAGGGGSFRSTSVVNYQENFDGNKTIIGQVSTIYHGYITIAKV